MQSQRRIRVLGVDDHVVVREGLSILINKNHDMEVVALAENAGEAVDAFRRCRPDVTLMDLQLPGVSGFEAIRQIRELDPDARIIVLTMYKGDADVRRALAAGAVGYLLKNTLADRLIETIREAYAAPAATPMAGAVPATGSKVLSSREVQVLEHLAEGLRDKEIGVKLGISEETVGAHVRHIFDKLNVCDRTAAVTSAIRQGVIHVE
jgi:DNA-binding NarL/FixJ family response regulator